MGQRVNSHSDHWIIFATLRPRLLDIIFGLKKIFLNQSSGWRQGGGIRAVLLLVSAGTWHFLPVGHNGGGGLDSDQSNKAVHDSN